MQLRRTVLLTVLAATTRASALPLEWRPPAANAPPPTPPPTAASPEESADDAAPAGAEAYPALGSSQPPGKPGERRAPPGYALPPAPAAGSELLWVPRIVFFPVYVLTEYVVRWPLVRAGSYAEQQHWPQHVVDFFTFGPNNQAALWPVFHFDLGFRPWAGLSFSWDDALLQDNALHARAEVGGADAYRLSVQDSLTLPEGGRVAVQGRLWQRPDLAFWGLGPRSGGEPLRYSVQVLEGALSASLRGWRSSELAVGMELSQRRFDTGSSALGDDSLDAGVASGRLPQLPPGSRGYVRITPRARAALDTRRARLVPAERHRDYDSPPGTGLRLAAHGNYSLDVDGSYEPGTARSWVGYGGVAAAYLDLTGTQRTLGLSLSADFVHPLDGGAQAPFSEQPALGGAEPMPGLRSRRLVGPSAVAARLHYRWPIWVSLDGSANAALGNVFGPELAGFEPALLRGSFALGVRSIGSQEGSFELLLGAGTDTLRNGADIEEVRFAIGTSSAF